MPGTPSHLTKSSGMHASPTSSCSITTAAAASTTPASTRSNCSHPSNDACLSLFTQERKSGHYHCSPCGRIFRARVGDRMSAGTAGTARRYLVAVARWFDTSAGGVPAADLPQKTDWFRCIPYVVVHLMCLGVIWVGWSPVAVGVAIAMYFIRRCRDLRVCHRYFSHRTYKTSRAASSRSPS